jgi:hypothetical protein
MQIFERAPLCWAFLQESGPHLAPPHAGPYSSKSPWPPALPNTQVCENLPKNPDPEETR